MEVPVNCEFLNFGEKCEKIYLEESSHGVELGKGWVTLCQLDGGDPQGPDVAPCVVAGVQLLLARDNLRGHPVRRSYL